MVAKIKKAFLTFEWEGVDLKKEFKTADKFIGISHKHGWTVIRKIDKMSGVKYECK